MVFTSTPVSLVFLCVPCPLVSCGPPVCVSLCLFVWVWLLPPAPKLLWLAHLHVSTQSFPDRAVTSVVAHALRPTLVLVLLLVMLFFLCSRFSLTCQHARSAHQPPAYLLTLRCHSLLCFPAWSATGSFSPQNHTLSSAHCQTPEPTSSPSHLQV